MTVVERTPAVVAAAQPSESKPFTVLDTRSTPHEDVLTRVERLFELKLDRASAVHGVDGITEGFRTDRGTWVRIEQRLAWRIHSAAWVGLEAASVIEGVPKPQWFQSATWADDPRGLAWRADEMEFVSAGSIRSEGGLDVVLSFPEQWWADLRRSLTALAAHPTQRVGMSQSHLSKRIGQVFDGVDTTVEEWTTAHADLHWGNVTIDGMLIDWQDWGLAPRGHDAATLWQSSLPNAALAERIEEEFAADLQTRSGKLSQLLHCANAIRIANNRNMVTPFLEPAKVAAKRLLAELSR